MKSFRINKTRTKSGTFLAITDKKRMKIVRFEEMNRDDFLYWHRINGEEKWDAFRRIRSDWIKRYGRLDGLQNSINGHRISFQSKLKWAYSYIDKQLAKPKKPSRLVSWFKKFIGGNK